MCFPSPFPVFFSFCLPALPSPFPLFSDAPPLSLCTFRETDFVALDFNMADHLLY